MSRITISVPEEITAKAEARATSQRRSVSSYVSLLIEADLREAGVLPGDEGESALLAKVAAAAKSNPGIKAEIEKVLRTNTRRRRSA